jgi:hypothetical protein
LLARHQPNPGLFVVVKPIVSVWLFAIMQAATSSGPPYAPQHSSAGIGRGFNVLDRYFYPAGPRAAYFWLQTQTLLVSNTQAEQFM